MSYVKCIVACLIFSAICNVANAQNAYSLNWDEKPVMHKVNNKFMNESAVILLDSRLQEFQDDPKNGMFINSIDHRLVKINDEKGVEIFNKVYIPVTADGQVISIKARTILPGGKVIELPQSKILDVEEEGRAYKKFAFEGVEKGSEVEYISIVKKRPVFFGIENYQSSQAPTQRAEFMLVVPSRLVFDVKDIVILK